MLPLKTRFLLLIILINCNLNYAQITRKSNSQNNSLIIENAVNDSLVRQLGFNIGNAIYDEQPTNFMKYFDIKSFQNKIIKKLNIDSSLENYKNGFLKGINNGISSIPNKIINEIDAGGYYDFVNYGYDYDLNTYYILYRLYSSNSGLNYHKFFVSKSNDKLLINDLYIFISGEFLSETIQRLFMYSLPKTHLLEIFGENNTDEFLKLAQATILYNQQKYSDSYEKFNDLKGPFSKDKFILIIKSICASEINDFEYEKSIKELIDTYPNDTSIYLSQIDYYVLRNQLDMALDLADKLEIDTSDDFIQLLKGNIKYQGENYEDALTHYKYISDNYPDFFEGHASYLCCLALLKQYKKSSEFLTFLVEEGYGKVDLIDYIEEVDEYGENDFDEFIKSKEYLNWKN